MAKFTKENPRPGPGRPKGSKNTATLLKAEQYLAEKGVHPVEEILKRIPDVDAATAIKAYLELLSYCQSKPKEDVTPVAPPIEEMLPDATDSNLLALLPGK